VAGRVRDLEFLPEAAAINAEVAKLRARGVRTIVLVIHEGLATPTAPQWVAPLAIEETSGGLASVLRGLDGGIDVVIAGHTHKLNNLLVRLKDGTLTLVTQARTDGDAISVTELTIDRTTGATVAKTARVAPVWADSGPSPDKKVMRIVTEAKLGHVLTGLPGLPRVVTSGNFATPWPILQEIVRQMGQAVASS